MMDDRVIGALVVLFAYIAWKRKIIQNGWGALWGTSQRTASTAANTTMLLSLIAAGAKSDVPQATADSGASGSAIVNAEPQGLAATIKQYGQDLFDYCLAFVNKTRQAAGADTSVYGLPTAADTCSRLVLRPGVAPAGASVCFSGPETHIGIANGGDSYTSAGLIHGGLVTRPYLSNPAYMGYAV